MEKAIEVQAISKIYVKRKFKENIQAVRNISFEIDKGEVIGLLGPNGAGKTSTIKMICGLLMPDEGSIYINGINMANKRHKALEHISAVLEGNRNLYWRLTVRENLEYFAGNRGHAKKQIANKIETLLEQFNLKEKQDQLVNSLSRGMQQKLSIAIALLADTNIILLDEPTLGLDVEASYELRKILKTIARQENRTLIISTHDMPVVQELCDRAIIINKGQVVIDDKVERLLKLFATRAYSVKLNKILSEQEEAIFLKRFPLTKFLTNMHETLLEVNLEHGKEMYELFEQLKETGAMVESIDRITIDFEQVFMKIIEGGKQNEVATLI